MALTKDAPDMLPRLALKGGKGYADVNSLYHGQETTPSMDFSHSRDMKTIRIAGGWHMGHQHDLCIDF